MRKAGGWLVWVIILVVFNVASYYFEWGWTSQSFVIRKPVAAT